MAVDIAAILTANIDDFKAKMAEAGVSMKTMTDSGTSNIKKLSTIGKGLAMGLGVAIVGLGTAAVDFGDKLELSQGQLQTSLKAAGISWDSVSKSVKATGDAAIKYGFTQAQIDAALTQGVISTRSYTDAHKNLSIAVELAAARHVDLTTAMTAVDKAAQGNTRALMQLGISLPVVATSALKVKEAQDKLTAAQLAAYSFLQTYPDAVDNTSKHHAAYEQKVDAVAVAHQKLSAQQSAGTQILDALSQRLSGQASAAADTFQGKLAAMKAQGENVAAQIGLKLIPVLERMMTIISGAVTWLDKHRAAAEALAIVIGGVLVGAIVLFVGTTIAEMTLLSGVLLGIPILIGLLVVGIMYLATHWHQVWSDIKQWTDDAISFIRDHFFLIMAIPMVGWMIDLAAHWQAIWAVMKTVIQDAWSVIYSIFNFIKTNGIDMISLAITVMRGIWTTAWQLISSAISVARSVISDVTASIEFAIAAIAAVIHALQTTWDAVWGALAGAVSRMWGTVSGIFGDITNGVSKVTGAIGHLAGSLGSLPSNALNFATFGLLAGGGPAQANMPYIVGEEGPELFIPSASGLVMPTGSFGPGTGAGSTVAIAGGGSGSLTVNFNIDGQTLYSKTWPSLQTILLQNKRSLVTLGLA
jgi:hypothetical protein